MSARRWPRVGAAAAREAWTGAWWWWAQPVRGFGRWRATRTPRLCQARLSIWVPVTQRCPELHACWRGALGLERGWWCRGLLPPPPTHSPKTLSQIAPGRFATCAGKPPVYMLLAYLRAPRDVGPEGFFFFFLEKRRGGPGGKWKAPPMFPD